MARKSRMGSDPLSAKSKKKDRKEAGSPEGLDALIRDTREAKETGKTSKPNTLTKKKKTSAKKKKAAQKPEKRTAAKKKKTVKKPAKKPEVVPEVLMDLELPVETGPVLTPAPEEKLPHGTVIDLMEDAVPVVKVPEITPKGAPPETAETTGQARPKLEKAEAGPEVSAGSSGSSESAKPSGSAEPDKSSESAEMTAALKAQDGQEDTDQYLAFHLEAETFAFEIGRVREVLPFTLVTKIPQTPDFMSGVINLRGNVVPVVDLRLLFGLEEGQLTADTCIIIVEVLFEGETIELGAKADAVSEIFDLKRDDIEPAPKLGAHLETDYIQGMGKKGEEFVLILDIEKVFSAEILTAV